VAVKTGLPLGLEPETGAQEALGPLLPGDGFVVFTDALYEARGGGAEPEHFGLGRIGDVLAGLPGAEPAEVVRALRGAAEALTDGALTDDLCIVAFRSQPTRAPTAARRRPVRAPRGERASSSPGD